MTFSDKLKTLANQEKRIFALFVQGKEDKQIAYELDIRLPTVRTTLERVFIKLGLDGQSKRERLRNAVLHYGSLLEEEPHEATAIPASELFAPDYKSAQAKDPVEEISETTEPVSFRLPIGVLVIAGLVLSGVLCLIFGRPLLAQAFEATTALAATQNQINQPSAESLVLASSPNPSATPSPTTKPTLTNTSTSTPTEIPTQTSRPTETSTLMPSPTVDFGPRYEIGDWHKVGNLWFRLFEARFEYDGVYLLVEMWNKTNQAEYFGWSTEQNMKLRDNVGQSYDLIGWMEMRDSQEIVGSQQKIFIGADPYDNMTAVYRIENIFEPGVSELYFTLEYFSDLEKATWRIPVQ